MASAATNYNNTLVKIQKLANQSALSIQNLVNSSNKAQMTFNSAEAQKSRDWQEKMSKSAHQMEVDDLKKAGLNPVLSTGGSGAQSYTTSSASTQNDSGSSAMSAILSDQLGAMSNMESARMNADATMSASAQQAKAARYAAQQSAAAQKYAADQSYKLGVYRANLDYKSQTEQRANERWKTRNATAGTWAGMIDKWMRNSGFSKYLTKSQTVEVSNFLKGKFANRKGWNSEKGLFFKRGSYNLTKTGYDQAFTDLRDNGFMPNKKSAQLFVRAVIRHDKSAIKPLMQYHISQYYKTGPGKNVPWKVAPGYR